MNLQFRSGVAEDGERLLSIHRRGIMVLGKPYYTEDELASWAHGLTAQGYGQMMALGEIYEVACLPDKGIVGFCSTAHDEIKGLSVDPDYARQGIASALLARAVERLGIGRALKLNSSLPGVPFYAHHGWQETGRSLYNTRGGLKILAVDMVLPATSHAT